MATSFTSKFTLGVASEFNRKEIYKIRYDIYARELEQHSINFHNELKDDLDLHNHYIVAKHEENVIGFISITPPRSKTYSVDKYFPRSLIPYAFDEYLYEVRLLTIIQSKRKGFLALSLMYAAFRWVRSHGGRYIVSICRSDIIKMYLKAGFKQLGLQAVSGKVIYDLCVAEVDELDNIIKLNIQLYNSLALKVNWQLPFAYFAPSACYHGGSFFGAVGEDLQSLENTKKVINADVLDAWFPPSPNVLKILQQNLSWLLQTSPPTYANGLIKVISEVRGVKKSCILPGAGSSDLIFLFFKTFLNETSRVLIIDPCYGEYVHVLQNVIQCRLTRFTLLREKGFVVDTASLLTEIQAGYDMVVLVNPNSPTGVYMPKTEMLKILCLIPQSTLVWIDETYIEYAGTNESLEQLADKTENIIICKSMSKVYALSGIRAAYMCCSPHLIETLKTFTPPWAISLPAQAAAIEALKEKAYYQIKYEETHALRNGLKNKLLSLGIYEVIDGVANFLLFYLPEKFPVRRFIEYCREENLFLRDVSNMGDSLGSNAVRIAVKDEETNDKMIRIMRNAMNKLS